MANKYFGRKGPIKDIYKEIETMKVKVEFNGKEETRYKCEICGVTLKTCYNMSAHLKRDKHKKKVDKFKINKREEKILNKT